MPSVMAPVGMAMAGLGTATAGLATAYVGLVSATAPVQERYMLLEARLKSVYGSQAAAKQQMAEIVALAQKNGVAIGQTADAYLRLARNNEAIGLTRRQTVELTNDIQMLGRVGSITSTEMSIGMMQFTQAMAAGRLNGDELRSVIENMQPVARSYCRRPGCYGWPIAGHGCRR